MTKNYQKRIDEINRKYDLDDGKYSIHNWLEDYKNIVIDKIWNK